MHIHEPPSALYPLQCRVSTFHFCFLGMQPGNTNTSSCFGCTAADRMPPLWHHANLIRPSCRPDSIVRVRFIVNKSIWGWCHFFFVQPSCHGHTLRDRGRVKIVWRCWMWAVKNPRHAVSRFVHLRCQALTFLVLVVAATFRWAKFI